MSQINIATHEEMNSLFLDLKTEMTFVIENLTKTVKALHASLQNEIECQMITKKEIMQDLGISYSTFWRYTNDGILPPPSANSKKYVIPKSLYKEWQMPPELRKRSSILTLIE